MAKNTKQIIKDTFMDLINQKPLDKITITEIIQKADISRNTFYYYFADIFDLIKQIFEDSAEELQAITDISDTLADEIEVLFASLKKNRRGLRHLYDTANHQLVNRYIEEVLDKAFLDFFKNSYKGNYADDKDVQLISRYHRYAIQGFVTDWIRNDNKEELTTLLNQVATLSEEAIYRGITRSIDGFASRKVEGEESK